MHRVDGVEEWFAGEPSGEFAPIMIVSVSTGGHRGAMSYLLGVLRRESTDLGGDGFIVLSAEGPGADDAAAAGSPEASNLKALGAWASGGMPELLRSCGPVVSADNPNSAEHTTIRALVFRYRKVFLLFMRARARGQV